MKAATQLRPPCTTCLCVQGGLVRFATQCEALFGPPCTTGCTTDCQEVDNLPGGSGKVWTQNKASLRAGALPMNRYCVVMFKRELTDL